MWKEMFLASPWMNRNNLKSYLIWNYVALKDVFQKWTLVAADKSQLGLPRSHPTYCLGTAGDAPQEPKTAEAEAGQGMRKAKAL